jgi:hypothetical protein
MRCACQLIRFTPWHGSGLFHHQKALAMTPLRLALSSIVAIALPLSGCTTMRKLAGTYKEAADKNEAGQLIRSAAPSDDQVARADAPEPAATGVTSLKFPDMKRAAKSLPDDLSADTANQNHIGEAIAPR